MVCWVPCGTGIVVWWVWCGVVGCVCVWGGDVFCTMEKLMGSVASSEILVYNYKDLNLR